MKKMPIKETMASWSSYELDGGLINAINKLQKIITEHPNFFDFQIEIESESGYYGSCSCNINIWAFRFETDEEFEQRKIDSKKRSQAAKLAAKRKALDAAKKERELYESLKRKFEKEINEGQ